jgi:hypothetical protein
VKKRRQTAKANGKKKKKPFTAADAHERGKAATPVVPMTASGMLNFEGWAKGNGVGKKRVGMAVNKASVGNEITAWGHVFLADEMDGDGLYMGKNTALLALKCELIALTGGDERSRKYQRAAENGLARSRPCSCRHAGGGDRRRRRRRRQRRRQRRLHEWSRCCTPGSSAGGRPPGSTTRAPEVARAAGCS